MSVTGQAGIISIAPQEAQFGETPFDPSGLTFYRWRADSIGLGTEGPVRPLDPETGGPIVPTGTYKEIHFAGGDVVFKPRLESMFGWLLYAALGDVSSVAEDGVTGLYRHSFRFASDGRTIPWLAGRKLIPGRTSADDFGEEFWDGIVSNLRIAVPQRGPLQCNTSFLFCNSRGVDDPSTWTYNAATEQSKSIPVSGHGSLLIGGEAYPVINAVIDFSNGTTTPQQEQIIGRYEPDGFTPLQRVCSIRFVYKYNASDLYRNVHFGGPTGTTWDELPFQVDKNGAVDAFRLVVQSARDVVGTSPLTPYGMEVWGDRATFIPGRVLTLQGATMVTQEFTLLFEEPAEGDQYFGIDLLNANNVGYYAWPTP